MGPEDIAKKQFTGTRLRAGYDPEEVDDFCDEVAEEVNNLVSMLKAEQAQTDTLRRQVRQLQSEGGGQITQPIPVEPSASVQRLLDVAQRTADEIVSQARQDALAEAGKLRGQLEADMRATRAEAEAAVIEAEDRRAALTLQIAELTNQQQSLRDIVRSALTRFNDQLGEG